MTERTTEERAEGWNEECRRRSDNAQSRELRREVTPDAMRMRVSHAQAAAARSLADK
jgi:hypothetical protein